MSESEKDTAPLIHIERPANSVALLKLNRPQARNALTIGSWQALNDALDGIQNNPDIKCVVLAGEGKYFCAGGDLKSTPAAGFHATAPVARLEAAQATFQRFTNFPVPIIAAVEGGAAGLGWSLALACDMIFAAPDATFSAPFVTVGVVPDGGAAWYLVRQIGRHRTAELLMGARRVNGVEAEALGLVNRVIAAGNVVAEAVAFAESLPAENPHAMELTKRLIGSAASLDFKSYLDLELMTATLAQLDPESAQARREFQAHAKSPVNNGQSPEKK